MPGTPLPSPLYPSLLALLLALLAGGCGDAPSPAPPPSASAIAHPATLEELMRSIVAAKNAGERQRFLALMRSLVPTRAELHQVLRPGPATEAFLAASKERTVEDGLLEKEPPADKPLPKTERTEVVVHAATTEELAAYAEGTTAFLEFPGGMQRFAQRVAAPGRTWFVLEMVEPGKDLGTRISCFTRLGERFLLLAKPWRSLPRKEEPPAEGDAGEPR